MKNLQIILNGTLLVAVFSTPAHATHKAWLMKNSGGQCALEVTGRTDAYPGIIQNSSVGGLYVTCPVTLAARGSSASNPQNFQEPWLAAKQARIFVQNANSASYSWCQARAEDVYGNVYFGASNRTQSTPGYQMIDLIVNQTDWGGSLEANELSYMEQLDIECRVSTVSSGNPGKLIGYEVASCQDLPNCNTVRADVRGLRAYVQGSGFECAPSTAAAASAMQRSEFGMKNIGSSTQSVHCPITQATDDSYEHNRQIYSLSSVHFTGPVPTCHIEAVDKNGVVSNSPNLVYNPLYGWLELTNSWDAGTGYEKALNLKCDLPANSTVEGWVFIMSVTQKTTGV